MLQTDVRKIEIGEEFRIKTPNNRIYRVKSDFLGTPIYIRCNSGTGIIPPEIVLNPGNETAEIIFQSHYLIGNSYSYVIEEQDMIIKTYDEPPVKKSIAGLQHFRAEIRESQKSLDQRFSGSALSFDQSYFTRTIGQIVIQYKLEQKIGKLSDNYSIFSGAGFGALQAFSCAVGNSTEELNNWYLSNFLSMVRKGYIQKGYEITTSVLFNHDHDRIKAKKAEKIIRYFFKAKDVDGNRTGRDLTIKDCKKDVYIPAWDISRRTMVITKSTFPDMPIYLAVAAAMFDPIFFETKPLFDGMGIMNGDIVKNNDVYLRKYNPNLDITSIGSPARVFDKGTGRIDERSKLIKKDEEKHDTDLDWSRSCGSKRYECTPIDECFQFASSDKAIQIAQKSGAINGL